MWTLPNNRFFHPFKYRIMKRTFIFSLLMMMLAFVTFAAPPFPDHSPQDDIKIEIVSMDASYDNVSLILIPSSDLMVLTTPGDGNAQFTNALLSMTDLIFYQHDQHYDNDIRSLLTINVKSTESNIGHLLRHPAPG